MIDDTMSTGTGNVTLHPSVGTHWVMFFDE